jgi:hypothetical protein
MSTKFPSLGIKQPLPKNYSPSSAEIKNVWCHTCTFPNVFLTTCSIKDRNKFVWTWRLFNPRITLSSYEQSVGKMHVIKAKVADWCKNNCVLKQEFFNRIIIYSRIQRHADRWKSTDVSEQKLFSLLRASFLYWLTFQPWRWSGRVLSKHRLTFNELHSVITEKIRTLRNLKSSRSSLRLWACDLLK